MITKEDVTVAYARARAKQCSIYRAIADLLAEHLSGVLSINEAVTTHSVYIQCHGLGGEIRISDHSKYGMRNPLWLHTWSSRQNLADRLNRIVEIVQAKQAERMVG